MQLPLTVTFEPPTRTELVGLLTTWLVVLVVLLGLLLLVVAWLAYEVAFADGAPGPADAVLALARRPRAAAAVARPRVRAKLREQKLDRERGSLFWLVHWPAFRGGGQSAVLAAAGPRQVGSPGRGAGQVWTVSGGPDRRCRSSPPGSSGRRRGGGPRPTGPGSGGCGDAAPPRPAGQVRPRSAAAVSPMIASISAGPRKSQ